MKNVTTNVLVALCSILQVVGFVLIVAGLFLHLSAFWWVLIAVCGAAAVFKAFIYKEYQVLTRSAGAAGLVIVVIAIIRILYNL